jgi:hypothetical protein
LRPLPNLAGRLSIAGISEADGCVAFGARIYQQLPDSLRPSIFGYVFNQFERTKPAPHHRANPSSAPPLEASVVSARHALPAFFSLWRRLHPSSSREFDGQGAAFIFLISQTPQIISFPPFFLSYSAATAGHKNGVERHKDGVKKQVLVTRAEWWSHERSERDRSPVASK